MLMATWKVAPALATGYAAILKPSELASLTCLELGEICKEVGLPLSVLNILTGLGPEAGDPLATHSDVDKVAFTGSSATRSKIMTDAAQLVKSENDHSLSGVPLTELYFDIDSLLLVSGDQSGMVRIFRFKPEPYTSNSFMSLTGNTKKGVDHVVKSMKLVKTIGAVICMTVDYSSRHLAVGSDQGNARYFSRCFSY